jgi:hypothetical protein
MTTRAHRPSTFDPSTGTNGRRQTMRAKAAQLVLLAVLVFGAGAALDPTPAAAILF